MVILKNDTLTQDFLRTIQARSGQYRKPIKGVFEQLSLLGTHVPQLGQEDALEDEMGTASALV